MATPPPSGAQPPQSGPFPPPGQPRPGPPGQPYPAAPQPWGQAWGRAYPALQPSPPVNGLAIAALVLGVVCLLPGLGLVLGVIALVQIRRKGERGKGMAVAGIALSTVGALLMTLALATGGARDAWEGLREAASGSGTAFSAEKGECFDVPGGSLESYVYDVDVVPCAGEHDAEVFAGFRLPDGEYPGGDAVDETAGDRCYDLSAAYIMDTWAMPADVDVYYYTPTRRSWRSGDRQVTCVFGNEDARERLTGSLRHDETTLDADQFAFLKADGILNQAFEGLPDTDYVGDDLPAHKAWAPDVVDALERQAAALRAHDWEPGAEKAVTAYAKALDRAREEWQGAADASDADEFGDHWDRAHRLTDGPKAVTAREALGLATTPEMTDERGAGEGDGGDEPGAQV